MGEPKNRKDRGRSAERRAPGRHSGRARRLSCVSLACRRAATRTAWRAAPEHLCIVPPCGMSERCGGPRPCASRRSAPSPARDGNEGAARRASKVGRRRRQNDQPDRRSVGLFGPRKSDGRCPETCGVRYLSSPAQKMRGRQTWKARPWWPGSLKENCHELLAARA